MLHEQKQIFASEYVTVKTILVVEDDMGIGDMLTTIISSETQHQALLAIDSSEALKIVKEITPHLFLLDYHLPSMNGLNLYDLLHTTTGLENIPVIFLTADSSVDAIHELEERRFVTLGKPFELDDLLRSIEQALA